MVGRPVLWGLSWNGQQGVQKALEILRDELKETMILSGCRRLEDIHEILVTPGQETKSVLLGRSRL